MATDTDDQGFDEALKNFQLLTGLSPAPNVTIPAGNPFQIGPSALEAYRDNEAVVKQIFGTHCECGAERMLPTTSAASSCNVKHNQSLGKHSSSTSLEHGIINPTPFKHKVKGEKKAIVRESMLKNIGKCVHQNLVKQNSIAKEATGKQQNSPNTFLPAASASQLLKPSLSETNLTKCFNNDEGDDILDFRLLVAQCSELTLSASTHAGKSSASDVPNYSQSSFKALRQQPDFSGYQLNRSSVGSNSRRNRRARQLKRYNSTSSLESDSSSSNSSGVPFGGMATGPLGSAGSCTTGPSTSQNLQQQQQSPSASSPSSSSASASCSTQARLNNVMPCDITIDEMASYFETLVHIPKKMSSMAEMMYI